MSSDRKENSGSIDRLQHAQLGLIHINILFR